MPTTLLARTFYSLDAILFQGNGQDSYLRLEQLAQTAKYEFETRLNRDDVPQDLKELYQQLQSAKRKRQTFSEATVFQQKNDEKTIKNNLAQLTQFIQLVKNNFEKRLMQKDVPMEVSKLYYTMRQIQQDQGKICSAKVFNN